MEYIPAELLDKIASADPAVYWGLAVAYPRFARSLTAGRRVDFAVSFGHDFRVYKEKHGKSICVWTRNGAIHRTDGPAIERGNTKRWFTNNKLFRKERDGTITYFNDGRLHREDGPAVLNQSAERWYKLGSLHREGGPATTYIYRGETEKCWYDNGYLHRDDGPAVFITNGTEQWYVRGRLHREDGPAIVRPGVKEWYQHEQRHRIGGPAIVRSDGLEEWYQYGKLHREGGPAIVRSDGSEEWYRRGQLHREDGPAITDANGNKKWAFRGIIDINSNGLGANACDPVVIGPNEIRWDLYGLFHNLRPARIIGSGIAEWWSGNGEFPKIYTITWAVCGKILQKEAGEYEITNSVGDVVVVHQP